MPLVNRLSSFANLHDLAIDAADEDELTSHQPQPTADSTDSILEDETATAAASSATSRTARNLREHRSGGRRPNKADQPSLDIDDEEDVNVSTSATTTSTAVDLSLPPSPSHSKKSWLNPSPTPTEARLTIVQITDVYTLDNFASLKTMLQTIRERQGPNGTVLSMLTGDFLVRTNNIRADTMVFGVHSNNDKAVKKDSAVSFTAKMLCMISDFARVLSIMIP